MSHYRMAPLVGMNGTESCPAELAKMRQYGRGDRSSICSKLLVVEEYIHYRKTSRISRTPMLG